MFKNSTFLGMLMSTLMLTVPLISNAQCPQGSNVTSNGFCFYATWDNPPAADAFPETVFSGGSIYTYQDGSGTVSDPAVYKSGGGNGACNAGQSGFTGSITVGDETCIFDDGNLTEVQVLPVVLISFDVEVVNDQVEINWATSAEINNEHFQVERTDDLESWELVAQVEGTNLESGIVEYSAIDNAHEGGVSYYRLSQKDYDGELTYLGVRAATIDETVYGEVTIFPNPAFDVINISPSTLELTCVELIDGSGRLVTQSNSAQNFLQLDGVAPGLYIIRATEKSGTVHTRKLIVQ